MKTIDEIMRLSPLMAVVTLPDPGLAEPLVRALLAGGVSVIEITLRTPAALEAIRRAADVPGAVVGAGTVLRPRHLRAAADAGAAFGVSPGTTTALLDEVAAGPIPLMPGAASASELMAGLERGYDRFKLFPAAALGGPRLLKAFLGPFPNVCFCPTGGIGFETAPEYLALPNVLCVGGSWMASEELLAARDWSAVEARSRAAISSAPSPGALDAEA